MATADGGRGMLPAVVAIYRGCWPKTVLPSGLFRAAYPSPGADGPQTKAWPLLAGLVYA